MSPCILRLIEYDRYGSCLDVSVPFCIGNWPESQRDGSSGFVRLVEIRDRVLDLSDYRAFQGVLLGARRWTKRLYKNIVDLSIYEKRPVGRIVR